MRRIEMRPIPPMASDIDPTTPPRNAPYYSVIDEAINGFYSTKDMSPEGKDVIRHAARSVLDSLQNQLTIDGKQLSWREINTESLRDKLSGTRYRYPEDQPLREVRDLLVSVEGKKPGPATKAIATVIVESVEMLQQGKKTYDEYKNRNRHRPAAHSFVGMQEGKQVHLPRHVVDDYRY